MREVRRLRQEKEWNQAELAFHAGLAPSVISEIETGKRDPSAGTLRKLASALEVDVPELFERADPLKAQAPLPFGEETPTQRRLKGGLWISNFEELAEFCENRLNRDDLDLEGLDDLDLMVMQQMFSYRHSPVRELVRQWCLDAGQREALEAAEARVRRVLKQITQTYALKRAQEQDPDKIARLEARRREKQEQRASQGYADTGT
jgi:transcriptional regulator with XRE-family HTH domain